MKILMKAIAGSHLFGLNTPSSDMDYKGVFIPSAEEILLGNYKDTRSQSTGDNDSRNGKDDIDVELYSLRKFFKMLANGDTAALELLFTPEEFILEKDPLWDEIKKYKDRLISSRVTAMIGYARQQANKYGIKGSRMGELGKFIDEAKTIQKMFSFNNPKLKHAWLDIVDVVKDFDHIHLIELNGHPGLDILGKKFDYHCTFIHVLEILKKIYKNYGHRARDAKKNGGVDFKALSHAVRVMLQGIEFLSKGTMTLPHTGINKQTLLYIKTGKLHYTKVSRIIEAHLDILEGCAEDTDLPDKIDHTLVEKIILEIHSKVCYNYASNLERSIT